MVPLHIHNIPTEILSQVFDRLPVKAQILFPLVCKDWYHHLVQRGLRWDPQMTSSHAGQILASYGLTMEITKFIKSSPDEKLTLAIVERFNEFCRTGCRNEIGIIEAFHEFSHFSKTYASSSAPLDLKRKESLAVKKYENLFIQLHFHDAVDRFRINDKVKIFGNINMSVSVRPELPRKQSKKVPKISRGKILRQACLEHALNLWIEKCAFYNMIELSFLKSIDDLNSFESSCSNEGRIGPGRQSVEIRAIPTHDTAGQTLFELFWRTSIFPRTATLGVGYAVLSKTVELLTERFDCRGVVPSAR
jgi:hypothetical protein